MVLHKKDPQPIAENCLRMHDAFTVVLRSICMHWQAELSPKSKEGADLPLQCISDCNRMSAGGMRDLHVLSAAEQHLFYAGKLKIPQLRKFSGYRWQLSHLLS